MVSAFAVRQRLVLDQVKVADKSHEIIAIAALLDMLPIEGAVITVDHGLPARYLPESH